MVDFASSYRTRPKPEKRRSLVLVYGLQKTGKTTLLRILAESTTTRTAILQDLDEDEITQAFDEGCEVVFVDGWEPSTEAVQWVYDNHYCSSVDEGYIIRIMAEDATVIRRAFDMGINLTPAELSATRAEWQPAEDYIRILGCRFATVLTDQDLSNAVATLARRVGLTE